MNTDRTDPTPNTSPRSYVAGILIDAETLDVALIRKNRPEWQSGLLNAIGGKVEPGEEPLDAMRREFDEETGVAQDGWEHFATVHDHTGAVTFYRHFDTTGALGRVRTTTDERVEVHCGTEPIAGLVPSMSWLLPLALYRHGTFDPVTFIEHAGSKQ